MAKPGKDTIAFAQLRGEVDAGRIRLEQLKRNAIRLAEDVDELLKQPPYTVQKQG